MFQRVYKLIVIDISFSFSNAFQLNYNQIQPRNYKKQSANQGSEFQHLESTSHALSPSG